MILIDTFAWIEYLRDTHSPACESAATLLENDTPVATCDTVLMEVLAGARTEQHLNDLTHLLERCRFHPSRPLFDSTGAADVYRTCRRSGFTPRRLNDCVIAAIALEHDLSILHAARDFAGIAEVTGLRIES